MRTRSSQNFHAKPFAERYPRLVAELEECFAEGDRLIASVRQQLQGLANEC
jgi:type I restriction enzyme M protein